MNKLAERLKGMLNTAKYQDAARQIEEASLNLLGDDHFAYEQESKLLAQIDWDKLNVFLLEVKRIRDKVEVEYYFAAKEAFGGQDE